MCIWMAGAADLERRSSGFSVTGALRPSPHRFALLPQSPCPLHLPSHRGWTTAASASSSPSGGLSVLPSLFASPCAACCSKYAGLQEKKERVDTNPSSTQAQADPLEVINGSTQEELLKRLEQGNLDPTELIVATEGKKKDFPDGIPECGTDALRFALISYTSQSDKINLDIKRVVGYRQWCNKLWNAIRFATGKLGDHYTPPATIDVSPMPPICKWILSVLNKAIGKTVTSLEAYMFADATSAIYSWWQYQLCDVFIEAVKPYFFSDSQELDSARAACRDALWVCLDTGLRLLHSFMPYVTEELWQRLPQPKDY